MNRLHTFVLFLLVSFVAKAQVTVEASIDSTALLVGEQSALYINVSASASDSLEWPLLDVGGMLVGDLEIVESDPCDTIPLNEGKRVQYTRRLMVTSFCDHDTIYEIPAFTISSRGELYMSKPLAVKIFTVNVDTLHTDQFFGPKEVFSPAITFEDFELILILLLFAILLGIATAYLYNRYRSGKALFNLRFKRVKKMPPHEIALGEINRIKSERKWAEEDSKEYYTQLTDALRTYIASRYEFNAMEMTSAEIIEHLMQQDDQMLDELRQLFTTADLVKFAKASTLIGENDINLVNAITYIQQTKREIEPNQAAEDARIALEKQRSKRQRRILLGAIISGVVIVAVILVIIGIQLWNLYR